MKIDIAELSESSIPVLAAKAMVIAHKNHETLNPAVYEVSESFPELTDDQLVLMWIAINAHNINDEEG